jgi:epoxyqueuosine reductase
MQYMTNPDHPDSLSQWIKAQAKKRGFSACGIAHADKLEDEEARLENWLKEGMHGEMKYMERNHEKRLDPRMLLEGAKSVITLLYNYFPATTLPSKNNLHISKYAYGKDYHVVIKEKLHQLIADIREKAGEFNARAFTDSAPVLERAWASRSGLGWIGKNTCLIHPKHGSFFFLAEIITELELESDATRINDLCGGCTRCIDSCPTGAIMAPRVLDSRKCISYLTIEYRGDLAHEFQESFGNMIFGCDICQDVCPWNRFSASHSERQFDPSEKLKSMTREKWHELTGEDFEDIFKDSAVQRTRYKGLKRNIQFVDRNTLQGL